MNLGPFHFDRFIALAPMENVTEASFRLICKRLGADLVYTEFTSSEALIRHIPKALRKIQITGEERPMAIQIFGSNEFSMAQAVKVVEEFQPDIIDINCGCWNRNHAMRGEGAGLLLDLPRLERILRFTVRATTRPVTVKTRLGWDDDSINILDVAKIVEQSGAKALTVHCRTRCQGYKGKAEWRWLEKIKKVLSIPLIGNGDVHTPEDVKEMFATGCDGVMIGRGALANPWIFRQAKHYLETNEMPPAPSLVEKIDVCIQHLKLSVKFHGMPYGMLMFRKYYAGYFHDMPYAAKLRGEMMQLTDLDAIVARLQQFAECPHEILNCTDSKEPTLCAIPK